MKHSFEIKQGCLSEKRTRQMLIIHLPFGEAFNVADGQIAQMEEETLFQQCLYYRQESATKLF